MLRVKLEVDDDRLIGILLDEMGWDRRSPWSEELQAAVADGYKRLLRPAAEKHVRGEMKARADHEAVEVFAVERALK